MHSKTVYFAGALALASLSQATRAQVWAETGDAGNTPANAQAPLGAGALLTITGATTAGDIDFYRIRIVDEAMFNATTVGAGTLADTQLFLFNETAFGVVCNDDEPASARSIIDSTLVTANGIYYIAVSGFNVDPTNNGTATSNRIFPNTFAGQIAPVAGAGPANNINGTGGAGTYTITLVGCEYAPTTAAEIVDAGNLPYSAQSLCGVGPLTAITGTNLASDVDVFRIQIDTPAMFSAACCGAPFDSQLFLFDANGRGVKCNDDFCGAASTLDATSITTAGVYYIAITRYNLDPSSSGGLIFPNTFTGQILPTGPGGALPVISWSGVTTAGGAYTITLNGCSFAGGAAAVDYGTGFGSAPGVPALTTRFPPQIGNMSGLTVTNPDATARTFGLALGRTRAAIPFLGGTVLVGDLLGIYTFPGPAVGATNFPIGIPNIADFCGSQITWQIVISVTPTMGFPTGLTLTNGVQWTFGI
jgi:hypothetical protein